jgi:hypothetical protein
VFTLTLFRRWFRPKTSGPRIDPNSELGKAIHKARVRNTENAVKGMESLRDAYDEYYSDEELFARRKEFSFNLGCLLLATALFLVAVFGTRSWLHHLYTLGTFEFFRAGVAMSVILIIASIPIAWFWVKLNNFWLPRHREATRILKKRGKL